MRNWRAEVRGEWDDLGIVEGKEVKTKREEGSKKLVRADGRRIAEM